MGQVVISSGVPINQRLSPLRISLLICATLSFCGWPCAAYAPGSQNIINPAILEPAARDSICEQCHLMGVARVVNPGKRFADFKPGEKLEQTFTIYHNEAPKDTKVAFKVISHSEQRR